VLVSGFVPGIAPPGIDDDAADLVLGPAERATLMEAVGVLEAYDVRLRRALAPTD
jgi:hypothetical protein